MEKIANFGSEINIVIEVSHIKNKNNILMSSHFLATHTTDKSGLRLTLSPIVQYT
jgi:hypothetical protein